MTVAAQDAFGNTTPNYTGTVAFTSTDTADTLPPNSTLTNGLGTFNVTFTKAGSWTITATDTASSAITGTSGPIAITAGARGEIFVWRAHQPPLQAMPSR